MRMNRFMLAGLWLLTSAARAQESAEGAHPKLLLMPFAAASQDVPGRAGAKATAMLETEFKSAEAFSLVSPVAEPSAPTSDGLAAARQSVEEAKALRARRKFRLADEALQKAISTYRASAAALNDVNELIDALALSSAIAFTTGRDEDGSRTLALALALGPDRDLPLAQTSALFAKVVAEARKTLKAAPRGVVLVESAPANAPLTFDGVSLGSTPLSVKEVPAGWHVWRVQLPNGETLGGVVEVLPGKNSTVKAQSTRKDPESRLLSSLAVNRLDLEAVNAAKEQARASAADFVLFGALSKDGKGLALDSFLYSAATSEVRRLTRSQFDTELLSAGVEFYGLAGELAKKGAQAGETVKVPSAVSASPLPLTKVAEARYGVDPGRPAALEALEADTAPSPVDGQPATKPGETKRRVPLKKQ